MCEIFAGGSEGGASLAARSGASAGSVDIAQFRDSTRVVIVRRKFGSKFGSRDEDVGNTTQRLLMCRSRWRCEYVDGNRVAWRA